ncbi:MAG: hydrogenase expression/formation protein HypE [Thermoplasmata archaeon]
MAVEREKEVIKVAHGAGGPAMRLLIQDTILPRIGTREVEGIGLEALDDGAAIPLKEGYLVVTTDSHVIKPIFFPGGDIGRLAVCGTVNDLTVMGAVKPLALTFGLVVEENFPLETLHRVLDSIGAACQEAGTSVETGDTKVMGHGDLDGIIINTTGVGITKRLTSDAGLSPGDRIILTGPVGDHGITIMALREGLDLEADLRSDVAPVNGLVETALEAGDVTAMKDPTRGGVSGVLHEMAQKSGVGILLRELEVPMRSEVRGAAELLGLNPLEITNEGKVIMGVRPDSAEDVLKVVRSHPLGREAAIVGEVMDKHEGRVVLDTGLGQRYLPEPHGEPLPRIC